MKPCFWYGSGGALMCDREITGVTQTLPDDDTERFYNGKYFVGESMSKSTAETIAKLLGGVWCEERPKE